MMMDNKELDVSALINDGQKDNVEEDNSSKVGQQVTASDYNDSNRPAIIAFYGDAMNDGNVNELVDDIVPPVIVLIGFPGYGKSTFVSSLYHVVMCTGGIGKFKFLDSETLAGFERRSHIRNAEIVAKERLDRTPVYADYFLSMLFENTETGEHVKVVFSDRSGETYKWYALRKGNLERDRILPTDCHIVYFMDSKEIADDDNFYVLRDNLENLSKRMKDKELFSKNKTFEVVYNKSDELVTDNELKECFEGNKPEIEQILESYCTLEHNTMICSKNPLKNEKLIKFFETLIENCTSNRTQNSEILKALNWVRIEKE